MSRPADALTAENVPAVFVLDNQIIIDLTSGKPLMLPIGRHHITRLRSLCTSPGPPRLSGPVLASLGTLSLSSYP